MLQVLRRFFMEGGPHRLVFTLPALTVAALRLLPELRRHEGECDPGISQEALATFLHELCERLMPLAPEESLRLWLLCASTLGHAGAAGAAGSAAARFMEGGLSCLEKRVCGAEARF